MKKFITTIALPVLIGFASVSCDHDDDNDYNTHEVSINADQLPEKSKTFLKTYFGTQTIVRVIKNIPAEYDGTLYEVDLTGGFEADFSGDGNWVSVSQEIDQGTIPTVFIDEKITQYISLNYPGLGINSIEKEPGHYEVELTNDTDLMFDLQGNFVKIKNYY